MSGGAKRTRDADRTREAILLAAEDFFARLGFERASVQQIAEAAGVARGTPLYFFGSKQSLYEAVLARAVGRAQQAMAQAYGEGDAAQFPEDAVASYVGAAIDFLARDQNFLRLMQREALGGGSRVAEFFGRAVEEGVAAFASAAEQAGVAPQRLMLDLTALCWYPFAHEHTIMPALGMSARDPVFVDAQKRHIGDLVRAIVRSRDLAGATPTLAGAAAPRA
jgi:AcrR family transcriptional regulator